jgi:hypothetical protein
MVFVSCLSRRRFGVLAQMMMSFDDVTWNVFFGGVS